MNWKTTLALLVLVATGGVLLWFGPQLPRGLDLAPTPTAMADLGTRAELERIDADRLTLIEVRKGDRVTHLERKPGGEWTMPGNWPVRAAEAKALAQRLASLHSRYEPIPLDVDPQKADEQLAGKGLLPPQLNIDLASPDQVWHLALGEEQRGEGNRFARPTYLRLDDRKELVRLAPGLVGQLDRSTDYYQQRRLFPGEHFTKEGETRERAERLVAREVKVQEKKSGGVHFALSHRQGTWELEQPVRDRLDSRTRDALIAAVPDLWAEDFITQEPGAAAALTFAGLNSAWPEVVAAAFWSTPQGLRIKSGLDNPQREVMVTRLDGTPVTLLIGRVSGSRARKVLRQPPPGMPPGMQPGEETVFDEYRYARLKDNAQIFEIRADRLKDIFVPLDTLRDARVAPFEPADAHQVEIVQAGKKIVLQKDKDQWKLIQPAHADADGAKVTELLGKLSGLQARDKDVIDHADPKVYGLAQPAAEIVLNIGEEPRDARGEKTKKERTLHIKVGKHDAATKKLYLMVDDWPRINAVEDSLEPLVQRPAVAYRGKRILDFAASELARIEVHRGNENYVLERTAEGWRLSRPISAEADTLKADQLASSLGSAEVIEYVDEAPRPGELERKYGLARPALEVRLEFTDKSKPTRTLQLGKARGSAGPGRYARLVEAGHATPIFVLPDDVATALDRDSLAYRPAQLWQVLSEDVTDLRVHRRGEPQYQLRRDGVHWKITGPFDAPALTSAVQELVGELASPHATAYKAHQAKDLVAYGLDRPESEVTVTAKDGTQHTLTLGKPSGKEGSGRYGKLAGGEAVFVVSDAVARAADRPALDLLDPVLLRLDPAHLLRVQDKLGDTTLSLEHKGETWRVTQGPGTPFDADAEAAASLQALWSELRAERFAAYGSAVDWARYGLDRPFAQITVFLAAEAGRPAAHSVAVGAARKGASGARYVRVDSGPGVAIVPAATAAILTRTYLDYVNHALWTFDASTAQSLRRQMGTETLEVVRKDGGWQVIKPTEERADEPSMQNLLGSLSHLRAVRIAGYPAASLQDYGLDSPAAVITLRLANGKPTDHVLRLGKPAGGKDRFAVVDDNPAVAVLPAAVVERLLAPALDSRDHTMAHFGDADRVHLERSLRRATFARVDGTWKLTEPIQAEAEQDELQSFVAALARLRADKLVTQGAGPEVLQKFGLEPPAARWQIQSGGKDVLDLLVGNAADGGRRYARLAGGNLVFLLDPKVSAQVMGEFRPRAVWSPLLDAAQVESVRYGYARNPFTLQKTDDGWQIAGRKADTQTVNDVLAALANLKLARYVMDHGADPKLFGLDAPYLTLVITTRLGQHTLQIGGVEEGTKGRYARVASPDRSDVFVLDEADCARILRDAAGLTRAAAPK